MSQRSSVAAFAAALLAVGAAMAEAQRPTPAPAPEPVVALQSPAPAARKWFAPDGVTLSHSWQRELGDSLGMGASVRWTLSRHLGLEADTEFRSGRFDTFKGLTANLVAEAPRFWRLTPYVVGGAGIDDYRRIRDVAGALRGTTELNFAISGGFGGRVHLKGPWSARADLRWSDGVRDDGDPVLRLLYGVSLSFNDAPAR